MHPPYKIIDNFLNNQEIIEIQQTIFSDNFPWFVSSHQRTVDVNALKKKCR
jgi:hypothetical protein